MTAFRNRTRTAASIPAALVANGKPYLVPLYHLLRLSDLAREGMDHSGSYRFADHVYGRRPGGRLGIGWVMDWVLLNLASSRSLRARYVQAKATIKLMAESGTEVRVLCVPCGLAREMFEAYHEVGTQERERLRCYGLDLDEALVRRLRQRVAEERLPFEFLQGDAFDSAAYPPGLFDLIISTGFTEFLNDEDTVRHYVIARERLAPGGTLLASGMRRHRLSDFLLRNLADLHTHYRDADHLASLCRKAGFESLRHRTIGLQTIVFAERSE